MDIRLAISAKIHLDINYYANSLREMLDTGGFDTQYKIQLSVLSKYLGKDLLDKKNSAWLRGGRFEYLFVKILEDLQAKGRIKNLKWNGCVDQYGISHPAPGSKKGLPDIYFEVNGAHYILELTTIKAASSQWSSEGSSVPYHIRNFINNTGISNVIGIFCAPLIDQKVDDSLKATLLPHKYNIISLSVEDLLGVFITTTDIDKNLKTIINLQYKR